MASNLTCVITSCGRHDLLRITLESLSNNLDIPFRKTIVVEDSEAQKPHWFVPRPQFSQLGELVWLSNGTRKGQIYAIDRAYAEVETDYIFHCEDDWEFKNGNFIKPSLDILQQYPDVILVALRGEEWGHPLISTPKYPFKIAEPNWRGGWGGLAWNPGLRRLSDYKRIGSFGKQVGYVPERGCGPELHLSKLYLNLGYVIAVLPQSYVSHLGDGRSVCAAPVDIKLPQILIAVPACHKFEYGRWESEQSPHYDKTNSPYGQDIHISGDNPRIEAVRQTWWKDIAAHKNVTGRFFYGTPHSRKPLPDEVFLNAVPDDYGSLPLKTIQIAKYGLREGYDYVFKADDDSAVYVDRLVSELITNLPLNRFDYAGYTHHNVCTGGPGYWLSRKAMEAIARAGQPDHWAEDVFVAKVMGWNNIYPFMLPSHRPGFSDHWFFNNGVDIRTVPKGAVTLHAVKPDQMKSWHSQIGV